MYVFYTSSDAIQSAVEASSSDVILSWTPPNTTALYLDDSTWADVWAHPGRYLIVSGAPVLQPYFTVSTATTSTAGQYTVTVTLNNPPSTPPASATLTVGATAITVPLSSNAGSITVALDASVQGGQVTFTASASGCVSDSASIGAGANPALKAVQVSGVWTVCPNSQQDYADYWMAQLPPQTALQQVIVALQHLKFDAEIARGIPSGYTSTNQQTTWKQITALPLVLTGETAQTTAASLWQLAQSTMTQFGDVLQKYNTGVADFYA